MNKLISFNILVSSVIFYMQKNTMYLQSIIFLCRSSNIEEQQTNTQNNVAVLAKFCTVSLLKYILKPPHVV